MAGENDLEQIEKLLALNLIQDKNEYESVKLLHRAGYNSKEIGNYTGINPSTVRDKISELRDKGELDQT